MTLETKPLYEFDGFRLDPAQHLLLRDGKPVSLTPKAFELLVVLVESGGRLLTKDNLMKRVWPDSFVEEANLTVNISSLRKALGEGPGGQELIETVPKLGYRFVAPVTELPNEEKSPAAPPLGESLSSLAAAAAGSASVVRRRTLAVDPAVVSPNQVGPAPQPAADHRARIASLALLVFAIAVGSVIYIKDRARSPAAHPSHRLAILPFQNLRQDPDTDFLGYSLADAVITKLGYVNALQMRPSYAVAKYRNQAIDIPKVAADLKVDTLLTGNFIRDGDDLRITCQLVDARSQTILWKGAIDLKYDKLLSVHDTVAQEIVKGLELNLSPSEAAHLEPDQPVTAAAYEYYLRGVDFYWRHEFPLAIKMLEKSTAIDPNYALVWAYLGASYTSDAAFELGGRDQYGRAQAAYERALALQPAQLEAHIFLANLLVDTGKVERAVPLLRDALKTNPNRADAHWELGYAYRFAGMLKESVAECERARQLDPLVKANGSACNSYLYLGQYDKFLASLPEPADSAFTVFYRGFGEYHQKNWKQASQDFNRAFDLDPTLYTQIGMAFSDSIAHKDADGLEILRGLENRIRERGVGDPEAMYKIAQAYAVLGDRAAALRVLRLSIENGFFAYPYFTSDPLLQNLRDEPEFAQLIKIAQARHEAFQRAFF